MKELMTCRDDIVAYLKRFSLKETLWSPKLDGVRCAAKDGKYMSRNWKFYKNFDCFNEGLEKLDRLLGTPYYFIDGEVVSSCNNFNKLSTQLQRKYDVDNSFLNFKVFDICIPSLPLIKRLEILKAAINELPDGSNISFVPHSPMPFCGHEDAAKLIEVLRDAVISKGYEGLVLKYAYGEYEHKRSIQWLKVKKFHSLDLKVIGRYEGTGKYAGMLGGLLCEYKGVTSRIGGGFVDEQRKQWWDCPESELPSIIEVKFQEITKANKLRFADFIKVRNDKDEVDG